MHWTVLCALALAAAVAAAAPETPSADDVKAKNGNAQAAAAEMQLGPASPTPQELMAGLQPDMACEACHAFVDSFYLQLNAEFQKRKKSKAHHKVLELSSDDLMWESCDGMLKSEVYGPKIVKMCRMFLFANRKAIRETFANKFEVSDNVDHFHRLKRQLCEATKPGCVRTPDTRTRPTECQACQYLMADAQRTVSWGFGRQNYGSKAHVYRALDDWCLSIPVRYGLTGRDVLFETCADLVDEYSTSIVAAIKDAIAPPHPDPTTVICTQKSKLCRVDGVEHLGVNFKPQRLADEL